MSCPWHGGQSFGAWVPGLQGPYVARENPASLDLGFPISERRTWPDFLPQAIVCPTSCRDSWKAALDLDKPPGQHPSVPTSLKWSLPDWGHGPVGEERFHMAATFLLFNWNQTQQVSSGLLLPISFFFYRCPWSPRFKVTSSLSSSQTTFCFPETA